MNHFGNSLVPDGYASPDGFRLGKWVGKQRQKVKNLDADEIRFLEQLSGWTWNAVDTEWDENFSKLAEYSALHGHCNLPTNYESEDGVLLGAWLRRQRQNYRQISISRKQKFEALPNWTWEKSTDNVWETGFLHLLQFIKENGHSYIHAKYKSPDGYTLGSWVVVQRSRQSSLSEERRRRLESIPEWSFTVLSDLWEKGFTYLCQFAEKEGHSKVPRSYVTQDGYKLGLWVGNIRRRPERLTHNQKMRLDALPRWIWRVK